MAVKRYLCKSALAGLALLLVGVSAHAEDLTLQQAVDSALKNNPSIASEQFSSQAAAQTARGARALTNPEIEVAPTVAGTAGSDSAAIISQPLELNGTRRVRSRIAQHEATAARFNAETTRRDVVLGVTQSYWSSVHAQQLVKLNQDNVSYLESIQAAVKRQYDVGSVPGSQVVKMDVEIARAKQELALAQLQLTQSKSQLNTLMGRAPQTEFGIPDSLTFVQTQINAEALRTTALAQRPEIASSKAELAAAEGQVQAASLLRRPDLALQARTESFRSDGDAGVAVAIVLPLVDWGSAKAAKQSAQSTVQSRAKELEAVRNGVTLDVEQALQDVNTSAQIVQDYQSGILDKSEELANMAKKGYEKGATGYLEVLEAQRTLRSTRSEYYSALADYAKALAQLEWAVGCPVSQIRASEEKK